MKYIFLLEWTKIVLQMLVLIDIYKALTLSQEKSRTLKQTLHREQSLEIPFYNDL